MSTARPFDLDKLDYEKQRRQKRRKLLLYSLPGLLLLTVLTLWFGLPTPLTQQAINTYDNKEYEASRNWLAPLTISSPEPFVIAYNSGTADAQIGNYDRAETELNHAVSIAPKDKQCMAAQNLASTLLSHSEAVKKTNNKQSSELLAKLQKVAKKYPNCFRGVSSGGGGGGGGSSGTSQQSNAPSESQQEQLKQREQAGRDRKAKYASDDKFDEKDPSVKRW